MGAYQEDHQRDHGVIKWMYSRIDTQVVTKQKLHTQHFGHNFFLRFFLFEPDSFRELYTQELICA
jgi:hypothetical protein